MKALHYLNVMLTVLVVLLALQLWTTWTSTDTLNASSAYGAGIPDAGAQRQQIIDQLKLLNTRTDEMKTLLTSGKVVVTVKDSKGQ